MSSFFTTIGVVGGGIVGGIYGGPTGAQAGAAIGGGIGGYIDGGNNAREAQRVGAWNSRMAMMQADYNARSVMNTAKINAGLQMMGHMFDAAASFSVARLNAMMTREAAKYNAYLLRQESAETLEALGLAIHQTNKRYDQIVGSAKVAYAANGVRIDTLQDTPNLVLLDINTEREFEIMILTKNGEKEAQRLLNAAARGEWEGNMEAMAILYDGTLRASGSLLAGAAGVAGTMTQAAMDANMLRYGGSTEAVQMGYNARQTAQRYEDQGYRSLAQAGLSAYSAYDNNTFRTRDSGQVDQFSSPFPETSGAQTVETRTPFTYY